MTQLLPSLRFTLPCIAVLLLAACGGGSSGTTYDVSSTAGTGGTITPSGASVAPGGTTTFTVTPNSSYVVTSVTGCGGKLSGDTYTTGMINASCTVTASFAAAFTWVSGSSVVDAKGVYGVADTAAAANMPGARDSAVSWTDASGNLWLFGGAGYDSTGAYVALNDLWKYSPSSGEWTWVNGSSTGADAKGVWGTQGVPAPSNVPGPRYWSVTWTDASGNLWLFGGRGYDSTDTVGELNDLWKYSPSSGEWTWVGGSHTVSAKGVYGTNGVAADANVPGARALAVSWTDPSGDFWLFGGFGYDSAGTLDDLNDLWKYSPSSGEWTWVSGSDTVNAKSVYGTKGVPAEANVPGAREQPAGWVDASGNLWLFGGSDLNDLWEYSPSSGEWTWVSGADTVNAAGVYGTQGVAAAANMPGARAAALSWTDSSGKLWLFGGDVDVAATGAFSDLSDLWEYSPSSNEWTWVGGSKTADAKGVYGTQGVAAAANMPGARNRAVSWTDASGTLWLFGGAGYDSAGTDDELNDLWKYPTQ